MSVHTPTRAPTPPLFDTIHDQAPDSLLALIGAFRDDPRTDKIDLGVGVYKDEEGRTPVMFAVKAAEARLLADQSSKSYLGAAGDIGYVEALTKLVFGKSATEAPNIAGIQTPGGTGALRLASELIHRASKDARIWVGTPTWINHLPIFHSAGLNVVEHPYFDTDSQTLLFDEMVQALQDTVPGDVLLLHGCCHNPTGADLTPEQWDVLIDTCLQRQLIPLIDVAYQGLGLDLEADVANLRRMIDAVPEAIVAYSCDKNFGVYRDRVGAIFLHSTDPARLQRLKSTVLLLARTNWSMPPDHGAALVRIILEEPALTDLWKAELTEMQQRIAGLRAGLAAASPRLAPFGRQNGMFSLLPLTPEQVATLRQDDGIYIVSSGRVNLAGMATNQLNRLTAALGKFL